MNAFPDPVKSTPGGAGIPPLSSKHGGRRDDAVAIDVQGLSKVFRIYDREWHRLADWLSFRKVQRSAAFQALDDISFQVRRGECLGIIGPNGAGKSTLLKILTGALYPSSGTFKIQGRVLSLLELGTGFHPDLTGRQNLYISSGLLGFHESFLRERISDIEEFAGLGDFFDRPVRVYSSGMYVRLAFSLFAFMRPEVLIIDEALSVGDVFFQQKCFSMIRQMISENTACLFVSHDTNAVLNLCSRAVLLKKGRMELTGSPQDVVTSYLASVGSRSQNTMLDGPVTAPASGHEVHEPAAVMAHDVSSRVSAAPGGKGLRIEAIRVTDARGKDTLEVDLRGILSFYVLTRAREEIPAPSVGIRIFDELGNRVFAAGSRLMGCRLPGLKKGDRLVVRLDVTFDVRPGKYSFGIGTSEPSEEGPNVGYVHDHVDMLGPVVVKRSERSTLPFYGRVRLPMAMRYAQCGPGH